MPNVNALWLNSVEGLSSPFKDSKWIESLEIKHSFVRVTSNQFSYYVPTLIHYLETWVENNHLPYK